MLAQVVRHGGASQSYSVQLDNGCVVRRNRSQINTTKETDPLTTLTSRRLSNKNVLVKKTREDEISAEEQLVRPTEPPPHYLNTCIQHRTSVLTRLDVGNLFTFLTRQYLMMQAVTRFSNGQWVVT